MGSHGLENREANRASRARRRKCNFASGADVTACEYCLSHGLPCTQGPPEGGYYARRQARKQKLGVVQLMPASTQHWPCRWSSDVQRSVEELPPIPARLELVKLYFDFIHDQFHSLFHRPTFMEDVVHGRVPTIVLFAIFALSSRFSDNEVFAGSDPRERGERFRLACEGLLRIRDVGVVNIQTFMLLGAYAAANGDTEVENLYYSLAGRMALSLNLPELPATTLLERELNLRGKSISGCMDFERAGVCPHMLTWTNSMVDCVHGRCLVVYSSKATKDHAVKSELPAANGRGVVSVD